MRSNATLAADQLAERLETEKLSANQLVPVFGVSVDKMLALTRQMPLVQIANVVMPTPEERAERRATDAKLDAIAGEPSARAPCRSVRKRAKIRARAASRRC